MTNDNPASDHERQANRILADYLEAQRLGQAPNRDDLLRHHPDLADELHSFFADQDRFGQIAERIGPPAAPAVAGAQATTVALGEVADGGSPLGTVRYFGDYELLEEIARGGMGIVYKARQVSLNRIVAIKMILAGQFASETEVDRFYAEARSAAQLQHPHIVAIHEVGKHENQHYFSMDYIEGKSLSQIVRESPLSAEKAAAYLKTIAEAIEYA